MSDLMFVSDDQRIHYGDDDAFFGLIKELRQVRIVARFTMAGEPVSKSRARFSKRGSKTVTYTPEKTKAAEEKVAWLFRQAVPGHEVEKMTSYGVSAVFFAGTRQRRDVDNMIKLVCDGLNGVAWADDVQVEEVSGRRGYDLVENARTEVLIYALGRVDGPRQMKCQHCGELFDTYDSWGKKKYCTRTCSMAARRETRMVTCARCGRTFDGVKLVRAPKYCSQKCEKEARTMGVICAECGAEFRMPNSTATECTPICGDDCREKRKERRASECLRGHLWADHGSLRANGQQYCKKCARLGYPKLVA
jgi:Holliday junction resolvase RusA-like endonuclease